MAKVNPDTQDLSQALQSLQSSLYVLMTFYLPYIKIIILALLAFIFYKLGSISVKDQTLAQKKQLNKLIQQRKTVKVYMPRKILQLAKINKILIILIVLIVIAISTAYYMNYKPITKFLDIIIISIAICFIISLGIVNIYKQILSSKVRKAVNLQSNISKKIDQFMIILGDKVNRLLRNHLCQQYLNKNSKTKGINQCVKVDCKQIRSLYKSRFEAISNMTDAILNFDFCSNCKKRHPFDEYLQFQSHQFQSRAQQQAGQVKQRMKYLLQNLEGMHRWILQCNPCNCSKLYMALSVKQILAYKQSKKQVQGKIKDLQARAKVK